MIWIGIALLLLVFSRSICATFVDYLWWRELGQVPTWVLMSVYRYAPAAGAWIIVFAVLWISHARGMRHAGEHLRDYTVYTRIVALAFLLLSFIIAVASIDGWTVARYFGGHGLPPSSEWRDPAFGKPLGFYFFDLPFLTMLIDFAAAVTFTGALVYYAAARGWQIRREFPGFGSRSEIDLSDLRHLGKLESGLLTGLTAVFLVMLAGTFWLGRYDLLLSDHGQLLVGIDYVQQHVGLPLQTAKAAFAILAALLVLAGRRKLAAACAVIILIDWVLPPIVSGLYVRPNELALERPFIQRHIEATRTAYGIDRDSREINFDAHPESKIDFVRNKPLLDNVRLWDWRAFHDTLGQIQPLRPYVYQDIDIDRYTIDGRLRQVLLAPRELELDQLGDARNQWINRSLIFTHGYGLALAEANRIQPDGSPVLLIKDAPLEVLTPSLNVTKPQIYYGEMSHEPVFVRTDQPEFDYPSGNGQVSTRYDGTGGFLTAGLGTRLLAAFSQGDWNIILSNAFNAQSRMMIRRRVPERLGTLAEFITWDSDPYMVITEAGRLVWIVDGYTTSDAHPYSRETNVEGLGRFNYIRNSVKATVDAYDGTVNIYVFDPADPLIEAYRNLFPTLFRDAKEMPADLRAHTRSPEMLFRTQAEIYRIYHMRQPESYYNRADMWDLATYTSGQGGAAETVPPTYMIAKIPGEPDPEFLLTVPFTPRGKQNLIGLMVARSDGPHLGELVFLDLPKQEIISGPIQVEALINQDQTISKDLTLWNQQGSQVLRSQILAIPIDNTFLYVAPIFLQAPQARMPQLKKVALVVGNTLVYADTYEEALAQLQAIQQGQAPPPTQAQPASATTTAGPAPASTSVDPRVAEVRRHLERYRELASQGKWADAGKELEAIESLVKK
jgi:uncharacterized membrane protein (UPF0182 family)